MKQVLSFLSAIFAPLGSLVRVLEPMLAWLAEFEASLNDPANILDLRMRPDGRRAVEAAIAFGEAFANLIVACRTVELLGLRRARIRLCRKLWEPAKPRDWDSLMQRYARMKQAFSTLERDARRRADRIRREIARSDATGLVAPAPHAHLGSAPFALLCAVIAIIIATRAPVSRGPPPVSVFASSV